MINRHSVLFWVVLLTCVTANAYDCFDAAAEYQGVRAGILRAIAIQENPRCDARVMTNRNGSTDTGCMQINSIHLDELSKFGIGESDLRHQCKNIFIAAWHYKKMIILFGNTWKAVGAYHSRNPRHGDPYAEKVKNIYFKYQKQIDPD